MPQSKRMSSRSKLPVLERYTKTTKSRGPSKYNSAAANITDDHHGKDYTDEFMNLINGISDGGYILPSFARFLGRDGLDPIIKTRGGDKIPLDYSGLVYDSGHWTGYENGKEEYNSYTDNLQIKGTDNYCQSFATYLWAKKGDLEPFVKGEYIENVQRMSKIWLSYFDSIKKGEYTTMKNSFEEASDNYPEGQNLKAGLITLKKLSDNIPVVVNGSSVSSGIAHEFSISKSSV